MDHITYDDDGNPVVGKPPPRQRRRNRAKPAPEPTDIPTLGNTPAPAPAVYVDTTATLTGIFEIESASYDVVLDASRISWVPVNTSAKGSKNKKSKASIMRKLRGVKSLDSSHPDDNNTSSGLSFRDLLGVKLRRVKRDSQKAGDGVCLGLELYVYDKKAPNRYKDRTLLLGHPSEDICVTWMERIQRELADFTERPTRAKVFLQPYAGKKQTRSIYESKVVPLFEAAGLTTDVTDVAHNEHIKQQFAHIELTDYDCVVCVGGDGTVHKVVNGLLNRVQNKDEDEPIRPTQPIQRSPISLGLIPTGLVNQIAHSFQGIEDVVSAAIHIILGHRKPVNVSALYHKDRLHRWAFNSHYGFLGNVLPYLSRYNMLGDRKMDAAIMKALTKKKFRSYEAEIKYIPSDKEAGSVSSGDPCTTGCSLCDEDMLNSSHLSSYSDDVQELDPLTASSTSSTIIEKWWGKADPLGASTTSSGFLGSSGTTTRSCFMSDCSRIADLSKEVPYKTIKGDFISVGIYSASGLSSLAPRGMSPLCHSNDGCLDMVLVRAVDRKEFVRFLRRHGNNKNQFDFPFVETYRCREVDFHIRLKETWKHTDYGFNEIDYEMERRERERERPTTLVRAQSADIIEDLFVGDSDSDADDSPKRKPTSPSSITAYSTSSSNQNPRSSTRSSNNKDKAKGKQKSGGWTTTTTNNNQSDSLATPGDAVTSFVAELSDDEEETSEANSVVDVAEHIKNPNAYIYRQTFEEMERTRRRKIQQKKDEKKRVEAETVMKSIWNLDTEVCIDLDLDFRCYKNMICVFAEGVSPDTEYDESKYTCLTMMK